MIKLKWILNRMFNVIKQAQATKNDTANTLIQMAISEKVSGGKSPHSGQFLAENVR